MHARVAVASTALDSGNLPVPVANAIHRGLMEEISAHGRLIFSDDPEVSDLIRAIKKGPGLPPDARKMWIETIIHIKNHDRISVRKPPGIARLAAVRALDDLCQEWGPTTDVAVIASEACSRLGVPPDQGLLADPTIKPEIATAAAVGHGRTLGYLKLLADRAVTPCGTAREQFWEDVLAPLATGARTATILDGYLFSALWDITDRQPWARTWRYEHVAWLLSHLDNVMAANAEVHLIAAHNPRLAHFDAQCTAEALYRHWEPSSSGGRLGLVTLTLAAPARGQRFPHDRHIRFSTGSAIEIKAGFDRLREREIWDPDGMRWHYRWRPETLNELMAEERRGSALGSRTPVTVIER
jgi:hypothetical protein